MQAIAHERSNRQNLVETLLARYKRWISPLFGSACRFSPTCAEYAAQAVVEQGWFRGSVLAIRRVLRCHPFGGAGFDPVPPCAHCRQSHP